MNNPTQSVYNILYTISMILCIPCVWGRYTAGADPGFFKAGEGVHLRSTIKKGGPGEGPMLGPMLKSLHSGPKRVSGPPGHPWVRPCTVTLITQHQ